MSTKKPLKRAEKGKPESALSFHDLIKTEPVSARLLSSTLDKLRFDLAVDLPDDFEIHKTADGDVVGEFQRWLDSVDRASLIATVILAHGVFCVEDPSVIHSAISAIAEQEFDHKAIMAKFTRAENCLSRIEFTDEQKRALINLSDLAGEAELACGEAGYLLGPAVGQRVNLRRMMGRCAMKAKQSAREFANLRASVREIITEDGTPLALGYLDNERLSKLIGAMVDRLRPSLGADTQNVLERIADQNLFSAVDEQNGEIMATYGDAGYFVGLCAGLELAELIHGGVRTRRARRA